VSEHAWVARAGVLLDPYEVIAEAYAPVREELDVALDVTGAWPRALSSVLYQNGPGCVSRSGPISSEPTASRRASAS
jgi:hypothetical protein